MMKYRTLALGAAAAIASLTAVSSAQASFLVSVWGGYNNSTGAPNTSPGTGDNGAQDPAPGFAPTASFTYNGPIDWVNLEGDNTSVLGNLYGSFFSAADISGFSSPDSSYSGLAAFLGSSMSIVEGTLPVDIYTYIQVTGSTGAGMATISHDDGASVYTGAPGSGTGIYLEPNQTAVDTASFAMPAGPFYIDYEETNGAPSILTFNVVPEPVTWAMMIVGVTGVGGAMRLRRSRNTALAVAIKL